MQSLDLFDRVIEIVKRRGNDGTASRLAARLSECLLREVQYLWDLYFAFSHEAHPDEELLLRASFENWARTADAAIERIARVQRERGAVIGLEELKHQHGRVSAMLSISLADLRASREQRDNGPTYTVEELRRELRLKRERAGSGDSGNAGLRPPRANV